jgi:hypothetical protein
MISNPTERLVRALERAATHRALFPYQRFHAMFERSTPLAERYRVLEQAVRTLGDLTHVDYGVLLACDNGLPGPDFFQRFQRHRLSEYVAVMGDPRFNGASIKRKRTLAAAERERVYAHVSHAAQQEQYRDRACA